MNIEDYIPNTPDTSGEAVGYPDENKKTRISKKSPNVLAAEANDRNELTRKKDILISAAIFGELESYIGEKLSAVQIRKMKKEKLESLFLLYQEKEGQETTNELMSSLVEMSVKTLSFAVDIDNQEELKNDLIKIKGLRKIIGKQTIGLTEKYGDVVTFSRIGLTVCKHIAFSVSTMLDSVRTMLDSTSTNLFSTSTKSDSVSAMLDSTSTNSDSASTK